MEDRKLSEVPDLEMDVWSYINEGTLSHSEIIPFFGDAAMYPEYEMCDMPGGWDIRCAELPLARGYFSGIVASPPNVVLSQNGTIYMSITPMELESHWCPVSECYGNTVIAGLGLGVIVLNLLSRESCDRIVVLEYSQDLIDMYPYILTGYVRELWEDAISDGTLTIIKADCREPLPLDDIANCFGGKLDVDHLYVDIWPALADKRTEEDTALLCKELRPTGCTFWGQELVLASKMGKKLSGDIGHQEIREAMASLDIPMSAMEWEDDKLDFYGKMIKAASHNLSSY